jgi:hypothetical protein
VSTARELAARIEEWMGDAAARGAALARQRAALPAADAIAAGYVAAFEPLFQR